MTEPSPAAQAAITAPQMERTSMADRSPLNTDMNASRWASEFVTLHGGDEDLMRSWFANALMCGWDNHYWTTPEYKASIDRTRAALAQQEPLVSPLAWCPGYHENGNSYFPHPNCRDCQRLNLRHSYSIAIELPVFDSNGHCPMRIPPCDRL